MFIIGGNQPAASYEVDNSLKFNSGNSDHLNRTPSTASNRKTFTVSFWVKKTTVGAEDKVFGAAPSGTNQPTYITFGDNVSDALTVAKWTGGSHAFRLTTSQLFRDVTSWYHIVVAFDTTQATSSNRIKIYVNGNQVTDFQTSSYPSLNYETDVNNTSYHSIGRAGTSSEGFFDGYLSEFVLIDGQQLDPTSFGKFDEISGIWKPIDVSGLTFGTNGYYLEYKDSLALGDDTSGNSNDFTVNNLTSDDQMLDTPTNNFCVLDSNFSRVNQNLNYSEGNLRVSNTQSNNQNCFITLPLHAVENIYFEGYCVSTGTQADQHRFQATFDIDGSYKNLSYRANGDIAINDSVVTTVSGYGAGDIISLLSDGNVYFYKNNTLIYTYSGTTVSQYNQIFPRLSKNGGEWILNFGQDSSFDGILTRQNNTDANGIGDFYYSRASSGSAVCTKNIANLDTTIINKPSSHFNTKLTTGTGSSQAVTGLGFQPDFIWGKRRDSSGDHSLFDSVRGITKGLESNNTDAEFTSTDYYSSFDSDGFTIASGASGAGNGSGQTAVQWCWKAGGTASSNTDGSITSTVSANPTANFSIVSWTGTGSVGTVGHGISRVNFMLIKNRSISSDWVVYHDRPSPTAYLKLNDTSNQITDSTIFNDTEDTNDVFTVGTNTKVNGSGNNMIAYCFGNTINYCVEFSQRGNGSTDGVYFNIGFRPAWIIIKCLGVQNWVIHDVKRNTTNPLNARLFPNTTGAEDTTIEVGDITNNGFKARTTNGEYNSNNTFYIGFAIAEFPQVATNGTALTAR